MKPRLSDFLTPVGVLLASSFVITGVLFLFQFRSRMGILEMLFNLGILFIFMPAISLWERRRDPQPSAPSAIDEKT